MNRYNRSDILNSEDAFRILKEIESNPRVTQRYLSKKCSISLGKINFLMNALVDKGMVEIRNFKNSKNKIAYMYLFTPQGIKIKAQLTRQFLQWKLEEYEKLKREIEYFKKEAYAISLHDVGGDKPA